MDSITELSAYVKAKAITYLSENDIDVETFPDSIVDFCVEYVEEHCNFPNYYTEEKKVAVLEKGKNAIAMACVDIFGKVGIEGEKEHTENGVYRTYSTSWISFNLLQHFPNYASISK